jgi:GntP family gluconate:H+ symporter
VGWITLLGLAICLPLAPLSQWLSRRLNRRDYPMLPATAEQFQQFGQDEAASATPAGQPAAARRAAPSLGAVLTLILVPLLMIMVGTTGATVLPKGDPLRNVLGFIGAPLFALMVAVGLAMWLIGRSQGWSRERTNAVMESALPPAATVILVTGAGGVFAKVLTATGIGTALSASLTATHLPLILLAFIISLALRAAQGSATVAILTTCGLLAEAINGGGYSSVQVALLCVAIGFGGLGLSHVNDSGFWIVTRYLGLSVGDGLRSWTVLTTVLGLAGFGLTAVLWALLG